jgi:hypothetical protein
MTSHVTLAYGDCWSNEDLSSPIPRRHCQLLCANTKFLHLFDWKWFGTVSCYSLQKLSLRYLSLTVCGPESWFFEAFGQRTAVQSGGVEAYTLHQLLSFAKRHVRLSYTYPTVANLWRVPTNFRRPRGARESWEKYTASPIQLFVRPAWCISGEAFVWALPFMHCHFRWGPSLRVPGHAKTWCPALVTASCGLFSFVQINGHSTKWAATPQLQYNELPTHNVVFPPVLLRGTRNQYRKRQY